MSYGDSPYGSTPYGGSSEPIVGGLSLVDVNTNEITLDAETGVTVTISGNTLDATAFKLKTTTGGFSALGLILSGTAQAYTVDMPDVSAYAVDTLGIPFSSANWSIEYEITADATTATLAGTHNPKSGWAIVDVLSGSIAEGSIFAGRLVGAPADTSQIYYNTASSTTVSPSGIINSSLNTVVGQTWDVASGEWEEWTVNIAAITFLASWAVNSNVLIQG